MGLVYVATANASYPSHGSAPSSFWMKLAEFDESTDHMFLRSIQAFIMLSFIAMAICLICCAVYCKRFGFRTNASKSAAVAVSDISVEGKAEHNMDPPPQGFNDL